MSQNALNLASAMRELSISSHEESKGPNANAPMSAPDYNKVEKAATGSQNSENPGQA